MTTQGVETARGSAHVLTCAALLWIAGNGTRLTILAVPPLIPLIHGDLHMSETEVGLLAGLPRRLRPAGDLPAPACRRPGAFARWPMVGNLRPHAGPFRRRLRARKPHRDGGDVS